MNINEAYDLTLSKVDELEKEGIKHEKIYRNGRFSKELKAKSKIPFEKWVNIKFVELSRDQKKRVFDSQRELGAKGIYFDSGGFLNGSVRDWELDWSFGYNGK